MAVFTRDIALATRTRTLSKYTVILVAFVVDAAQLGLRQEEAITGLSFLRKDKLVIASPGKGH